MIDTFGAVGVIQIAEQVDELPQAERLVSGKEQSLDDFEDCPWHR